MQMASNLLLAMRILKQKPKVRIFSVVVACAMCITSCTLKGTLVFSRSRLKDFVDLNIAALENDAKKSSNKVKSEFEDLFDGLDWVAQEPCTQVKNDTMKLFEKVCLFFKDMTMTMGVYVFLHR